MAITVGDALIRFRGDSGPYRRDLQKNESRTRRWGKNIGGIVKNAVGYAFGQLAVKAIGAATRKMGEFITESAKLTTVERTFGRLVESIGGTTATAMEKLRTATRHMVADAEIWEGANRFLAMGLARTEDEAAKLAEMATQLGSAMGEDAGFAMENFALMLANQSIPRLDTYGISAGKVKDRITELQAATKGMSREEAFLQAVMEQGGKTMERVGEQGDTVGAMLAKVRAGFRNLGLRVSRHFMPILGRLLKPIGVLVEKYGPKLEHIGGQVAKIFGSIIDAAEVLLTGGDPGEILDHLYDALFRLGTGVLGFSGIDVRQLLGGVWDFFEKIGQARRRIARLFTVLSDLYKTGGIKNLIWAAKELGTGLWNWLRGGFGRLKEKLPEWKAQIGEWFSTGWVWIKENAPVLFQRARTWIANAFATGKEKAQELGPKIWAWVSEAWGGLQEKATILWRRFGLWLLGVKIHTYNPLKTKIVTAVGEAWAALKDAAPFLWGQFLGWLEESLIDASLVMVALAGKLKQWTDTDEAQALFMDIGQKVTEWILGQIKAVFADKAEGMSLVETLAFNLAYAVGLLSGSLAQIGTYIAFGIIQGIANMFATEQTREELRQAIEDALLGRAPTARPGAEGLAEQLRRRRAGESGWEYNEQMAEDLAADLAARRRGELGGILAPSGTSIGTQNNIEVTIESPEGDPEPYREAAQEGTQEGLRAAGYF